MRESSHHITTSSINLDTAVAATAVSAEEALCLASPMQRSRSQVVRRSTPIYRLGLSYDWDIEPFLFGLIHQ